MKFLALLFLVGVAVAAPFRDELDHAADEIVRDFMASLERSPLIMAAEEGEDDVKTELGKKLRESLDHILEKIRDAIDHGKTVKEEVIEKLKEIREKMKDLHLEIGEKAKDLLQKIKDHAKDFLKNLLEKLGLKDKEERSLDGIHALSVIESLKEKFEQLKEAMKENLNMENMKAKIEELFGKRSKMGEKLVEMMKEGKDKLHDFIERFTKSFGPNRKERSLKELWEKVKDYFENLKIELKEKYMKFGEWVKNTMAEKLEKGKSQMENVKEIAKEFIEKSKNVGKDVAAEALEFFREFKDDLGDKWEEVKGKVKDILKEKN